MKDDEDDDDADGDEEDGDADHGFFGTDESAFLARFSHVHIRNVTCAHPSCALTADFEGIERSRVLNFKPGEKRGKRGSSTTNVPSSFD